VSVRQRQEIQELLRGQVKQTKKYLMGFFPKPSSLAEQHNGVGCFQQKALQISDFYLDKD